MLQRERHRAGRGTAAGLWRAAHRLSSRARAKSLANAVARAACCARSWPSAACRRRSICPGDYSYDTAYAATVDLFRVGDGADAIFAANDVGAFGVLDALRHELGLRVPQDVKVVGFDDIAQSHWKSYNLTTVKFDLRGARAALVRLILRRLNNPDAPVARAKPCQPGSSSAAPWADGVP